MKRNIVLNNVGLDKIYSVYNDSGALLIYTTNGKLAHFVAQHAPGVDPALRLRIGGDPGIALTTSAGVWIRMVNK